MERGGGIGYRGDPCWIFPNQRPGPEEREVSIQSCQNNALGLPTFMGNISSGLNSMVWKYKYI